MQVPEPAERAGKLEEALRRARAQPIERGAKVVVLALEEIEILLLSLAAPLVRIFCERFEIRRMPIANGAGKIALGELFQSEGADRLEHAEALALASYETLVYQTGRGIERGFAYGLRRFQRESAREDAELREEIALALVEQVVTPRDRVADGLLALRQVARAARQELQPFGQALDHRRRREATRPRGRKLDSRTQ